MIYLEYDTTASGLAVPLSCFVEPEHDVFYSLFVV